MKRFALAWTVLVSLASAASIQAQSLTTELDITTGYSTEAPTWVGASQLRVFGEIKPEIRFNVEGTWARRSFNVTDAFGAAYPYSGHIQLSEAYAERTFQNGNFVTSIRGGQYRSPFGIYSRADHGYSGFLRAPLMRSEYCWSINNTMLERGMDLTVGTTHLSAEVSIGTPGDTTAELRRHSGFDSVVRVQAYYKALIVGASHVNSKSYAPAEYGSTGRMNFSGVDFRWTSHGVQFRGEGIFGQQWDGSTTRGGYVDTIVHQPFMGPVTAVLRTEHLTWSTIEAFEPTSAPAPYVWRGFRQTIGMRVRIPHGLTAQFNVLWSSELVAYREQNAFDIGLTYSVRRNHNKSEN